MAIPRIAAYDMPRPSDLPQNRVDWRIKPQRSALLIHDLQRYFLDFFDTGAAPVPELLTHVKALRERCKRQGIPVIYTAQPAAQTLEERGLLTDFWGPGITGLTEQQAIVDAVAPEEDDHVLTKWRYSAFQRTELRELLRREGRDQLIICGVYAHIGCMLTACDAFMEDVQAFLVGDAVADFSLEQHRMALDYVAQRCGVAVSCAKVLEALPDESPGDAPHEDTVTLATLPPETGLLESLRREVAALLGQAPETLGNEDDLLDLGLDSIRLMSLVEQWRARGMEVEFVDLAERPTLTAWTRRLAGSGNTPVGAASHG